MRRDCRYKARAVFTDAPNINLLWATLMVDEFVRRGVREFVVCPGSRSAPLALAVAQHRKARATVHYDERGASFFALGIGKATRTPAVFICTSGTAVANALPAVVEANRAQVPLVLLTADRPPELHGVNANQTIQQSGIFGVFPKRAIDLPCADAAESPEWPVESAAIAAAQSMAGPCGPVHINCPYREPLAPDLDGLNAAAYLTSLRRWVKSGAPFAVADDDVHATKAPTKKTLRAIRSAEGGLLVVGPLDADSDRAAARSIAKYLGWPVAADPASGIRFVGARNSVVSGIDRLLSEHPDPPVDPPDVVLHVGNRPTSKALATWLDANPPGRYVRVGFDTKHLDPGDIITDRIESELPGFADALCAESAPSRQDGAWAKALCAAADAVRAAQLPVKNQPQTVDETAAVHAVIESIPRRAALFLGNSMPIRHADRFASDKANVTRVYANRGASGIDGNIATAAGISRALKRPVVAVIGDLAGLHDLNSLALLREPSVRVVLVVLNNGGGGIFARLPIARHRKHFETFFTTPHGLGFKQFAAGYGLAYVRPKSLSAIRRAIANGTADAGSVVIEIPSADG